MEKKITLEYTQLDHWNELSESDQGLVEKAYSAMEDAYAPYSKFRVGAALLLDDGNVVKGSNQENIASPSGLCAERVALFYAGANYPSVKVNTLCIVAHGDLVDTETILSPCGSCRQVMVETEKRQNSPFRVILVSQNNKTIITKSAASLLPLAFGV